MCPLKHSTKWSKGPTALRFQRAECSVQAKNRSKLQKTMVLAPFALMYHVGYRYGYFWSRGGAEVLPHKDLLPRDSDIHPQKDACKEPEPCRGLV
jgi:hypothetical protein